MEKDIQLLITSLCRQAVSIYEREPILYELGVAEGLLKAVEELLPWSRPNEKEESRE